MAISSTDLKFVYPEYKAESFDELVGGFPTDSLMTDANVSGEIQLFDFAILYGSTYKQYQKLFILNDGDETAQNVSIYGYNENSNSVVKMALERGQDGAIVYDGQEQIKNYFTEPTLFVENYTFQEITSGSPLAISDIPVGSAVGVWLKLEFSSIDSYNEGDEFKIGLNFEGVAGTPLNSEKTIGHSRLSGSADIVQVKDSEKMFGGIEIEYKQIDTDALGIPSNEAVYAVYIDRLFKQEHFGNNKVLVQLYRSNIPVLVEIYLLPNSGYRPTLDDLPTQYKNRLKLSFRGKNPLVFDVERHLVYWDNATGTGFVEKPVVEISADGSGGGDISDKITVTK